ncbi:MAG: hypothetical protein N2235_05400 [Fischerella sp.]|nr:hypothetical protein [Fischerella sp.]
MTNLTRDDVRQLRLDIMDALKTVQTKHGMSFSLGTIRFDSFGGTMRTTLEGIKVGQPGQQSASPDRTSNPLVGAALKAAGIDATKTYYTPSAGTFKVVDFVARRHKYPVTIRTTTGRTLKVATNYIKLAKVVA